MNNAKNMNLGSLSTYEIQGLALDNTSFLEELGRRCLKLNLDCYDKDSTCYHEEECNELKDEISNLQQESALCAECGEDLDT